MDFPNKVRKPSEVHCLPKAFAASIFAPRDGTPSISSSGGVPWHETAWPARLARRLHSDPGPVWPPQPELAAELPSLHGNRPASRNTRSASTKPAAGKTALAGENRCMLHSYALIRYIHAMGSFVDLPRMPSFRLEGRQALVTGGSRGIGLAAASALAQAGAAVTLTARASADAERAASAIVSQGGVAVGVKFEASDAQACESLGTIGPFDILVNNAGIARHRPFLEVETPDFDAVMDVNVRGAFLVAQSVARSMAERGKGGSIINISSQMGHVGGPNRSVYCASKFAVEGMTRAMAIELGRHNIRVNTLCPTFIETPLTRASLADPAFSAWVLEKIKLGRLANLDEVMGPIVFLASDAASMVTGSSLMIDGGWTAG